MHVTSHLDAVFLPGHADADAAPGDNEPRCDSNEDDIAVLRVQDTGEFGDGHVNFRNSRAGALCV